jgi:hypothetical protein
VGHAAENVMGDVVNLDVPIADGIALNPDTILEANKSKFQQVVIVGYDHGGQIAVCSTHSSREALWMLERGKLHLMLETE